MPVGNDTCATRRHLPHLEKRGKTFFITAASMYRSMFLTAERDIISKTALYEHGRSSFVHCFVVMPDHLHIVLTPFENFGISEVMQRIKSVSSHRLKRGVVWQDESFDRIVRAGENLRRKCEYVCANPLRAGLVLDPEDYPWTWREWIEGRARTGEGACPPLVLRC